MEKATADSWHTRKNRNGAVKKNATACRWGLTAEQPRKNRDIVIPSTKHYQQKKKKKTG
jgi:hypothetical protein